MARLSLLAVTLLVSAVCVFGRLQVEPLTEFDINGLEVLQGRYGSSYPGYENFGQNVGLQQPVGGVGLDNINMMNPLAMGNVGGMQDIGSFGFGNAGINTIGMNQPLGFNQPLGMGMGIGQQQQQQQFGLAPNWNTALNTGVGMGGFGASGSGLGVGMGSKKGQTTVAAPIYAESMIVPKIITQPILRPHMVTQPIVQQQLIQQPIVETRQVIQPVVRRIITQPIIRPQILESTTIQPTLKQETIVQPHLIEQTVITPNVQNVAMENAPIQEAPTTQVQQAVVQPVQSGKKGGQGVGAFGLGL